MMVSTKGRYALIVMIDLARMREMVIFLSVILRRDRIYR